MGNVLRLGVQCLPEEEVSGITRQLMSRYGFTGRPFEAQLFSLEPPSSRTNGNGTTNGSIASSFAALNQLVSSAGEKENMQSHLETLGLKRCFDPLDVEPLPFTLLTASDGTRLESADAENSQLTAVALNGLVEASKLEQNKEAFFNVLFFSTFNFKICGVNIE